MMIEKNLEDIRRRARSQALYALLGAVLVLFGGVIIVTLLWEAAGIQNVLLIAAISVLGATALIFVALSKVREERTLKRVPEDEALIQNLADRFLHSAKPTEDAKTTEAQRVKRPSAT